jgi:hypothetical protein
MLRILTPFLFALSNFVGSVPCIGRYLRYLIPVANYTGILPLSRDQQLKWSLLDTFDWFSPTYDNPQTSSSVLKMFKNLKFSSIEVFKLGHLVGRGIK